MPRKYVSKSGASPLHGWILGYVKKSQNVYNKAILVSEFHPVIIVRSQNGDPIEVSD